MNKGFKFSINNRVTLPSPFLQNQTSKNKKKNKQQTKIVIKNWEFNT